VRTPQRRLGGRPKSYGRRNISKVLAQRTYWLAVASFVIAGMAAAAAVAAIFVSIALAH